MQLGRISDSLRAIEEGFCSDSRHNNNNNNNNNNKSIKVFALVGCYACLALEDGSDRLSRNVGK
jgi:hypothetical protein